MSKSDIADYIANECSVEPYFLYYEKDNVIVVGSGSRKFRITVSEVK